MRHRAGSDRIMPAMEVADEADHLRFSRVGTREAEREMRGFGAGCREAHALGAWDEPLHQLCPAYLQLMRGAPVRALRDLMLHGCDHGRMHVAEQERTMPAEVIDIFVAIDIPLEGPGGACRIDRVRQQRA